MAFQARSSSDVRIGCLMRFGTRRLAIAGNRSAATQGTPSHASAPGLDRRHLPHAVTFGTVRAEYQRPESCARGIRSYGRVYGFKQCALRCNSPSNVVQPDDIISRGAVGALARMTPTNPEPIIIYLLDS